MALGKGGQSNNQSGSYSGQTDSKYTGQSDTSTTGSQSGTQSGTTSTTGSTTTTQSTTPTAPAGWQAAWQSLMGKNPAADYFGQQINRNAITLATDQKLWPDLYKPINDVTAGTVNAPTAADFVGKYTPFLDNTLDKSLAAYDLGADRAANQFRAANAGAFNNKRVGVAQGEMAADSAVGRGQLASNILQGGYASALAPATADAERAYGASSTNVGNALRAGEFNNTAETGRQEFDVNAAYRGNEQRDSAANDYLRSILAPLSAGTPLFGTTSTGTGQTSSDSVSNFINNLFTSGSSSTSSSGSQSGSSSGTQTGNSSGKSGGISLG